MKTLLATAAFIGLGLAVSTPASAQSVGSSSLATHRSCSSAGPTDLCDGAGAGQNIVTRSYGGGVGVGGTNSLSIGGGNLAWSNVSFGAFDLPVIRAYTAAPGNVRMNINAFAFQSYVFGGPAPSAFSISGDLHIVDSSNNPADGALPGGAIYSQYLGIWDPSVIAGLTTPEELFTALFYAPCGTAGVLGQAFGSGNLSGGGATYTLTTTECAAGSLLLTPGQEVLVVAGLQLPVNRGGFADSTSTFLTRFGDDLTDDQKTLLETSVVSALDRGATLSVPDAPTWAMLITGFFGIGAMLRRRRPVALIS